MRVYVQYMSQRPMIRLPIAWSLFIQLLAASLYAQELETERWKVPMKVDNADVSTDMLLEFSFERIETLFNGYVPGEDADRQVMDQFLQALVAGDIETALDFTNETPAMTRESSRELVQAFSGMLEATPDILQLDRIIHLGSDRMLLWSVPMDTGGRFYRSFRFVRNANDELRYEGVESESVTPLIMSAFQVSQGAGVVPDGENEREYDYAFPGTEGAPVSLAFNGTEIEVDAFSPLGETGIPEIDFFNQTMETLANGTADEYAEYYTDYSEGRYSDWAIDQGIDGYEAYRSDMLGYGARVVFVLEADPISLIFYTATDVTVSGSPLRYTPVYDNPETGLELTNFYVYGLSDAVLQRREYFEEPFLRPLLETAGFIPENQGVVRSNIVGEGIPDIDIDEMLEGIEIPDLEDDINNAPPASIGDIAGNRVWWPWFLLAGTIVALVMYFLGKRNRNDS